MPIDFDRCATELNADGFVVIPLFTTEEELLYLRQAYTLLKIYTP